MVTSDYPKDTTTRTTISYTNPYYVHKKLNELKNQLLEELNRYKHRIGWHCPINSGNPIHKPCYVRPYVRNRLRSSKLNRINNLNE